MCEDVCVVPCNVACCTLGSSFAFSVWYTKLVPSRDVPCLGNCVLQVDGFNVFSYVQYLYGVAVVATLDWDTPDAYLVDENDPRRSRWLLKNCVFVRLAAGETFYEKDKVPARKPENRFSLFAQTVKRRRIGGL